jgi:FkbM family methyltransferase
MIQVALQSRPKLRRNMTVENPKVVATYHGLEVLSGDHLGPQMIRHIIDVRYERREVEQTLNEVKETDNVVEMDSGAGIVGAIIAGNCKPKKMIRYEANHTLINHIKRLYAHNKIGDLIEVRNEIVMLDANAPEKVDFFIRGNFLGSGMVITKGAENATKVSVPVVGWEEVKEEVKPTILLMDIEGAELEFFRYADLSGIRTIIVELHRHIYHRPSMREIRQEILVDKGFNEDRECSGGGVFVFRAA